MLFGRSSPGKRASSRRTPNTLATATVISSLTSRHQLVEVGATLVLGTLGCELEHLRKALSCTSSTGAKGNRRTVYQ